MAASAVAFVAMVVFNPFHLTNLTHTFIISVSKHAERWRDVHEWHRAFDWTNPVGTAVPFLVMYILGWLVVIAWVVLYLHVSRATNAPARKKGKVRREYAWPKMDLVLLVVAALTIYMAIRSRRFIPIAAFAACPIIALLIDLAARIVAAMLQASGIEQARSARDTAALARGADHHGRRRCPGFWRRMGRAVLRSVSGLLARGHQVHVGLHANDRVGRQAVRRLRVHSQERAQRQDVQLLDRGRFHRLGPGPRSGDGARPRCGCSWTAGRRPPTT